ncbi:MAG: DUF1292 domain-containing protein [Anaerolineae bacterium]|nr:DUF1292 domain-containing protein [Anaerolineae bacterium]
MEIIVLSDEDGNEQEFVLVEVITVAGSDYAVLTPLDDDEADDEEEEDDEDKDEDEDSETPLMILRIEKEGDEEVLVEIEDEAEFEQVVAAWEEKAE